ncbi:transposase [Streptomyces globisporus]|uniref:transposase n=1 Tax=Streptomyces globisporus TaxID=1908 RepID=UPI00378A1E02
MIRRHELSDAEWEFVRPLLPVSLRGRKRLDDRRVLNRIVWKFRTGTAWRDVPERADIPRGATSSGSDPALEVLDPPLTEHGLCEGATRSPIDELPNAYDSEPCRGNLSTKRQVKGSIVLQLSADRTGDSHVSASIILMTCPKPPHIAPALIS